MATLKERLDALATAVAAQFNAIKAGLTFTGRVLFAASATGGAGVNLGVGVAPTAPANGDLWITSTSIQARIAGVTYSLPLASATQTITGAWTFSGPTLAFGGGTASGTITVAAGATGSGGTKTVGVGTSGVAGSTTNITVGTNSGGASNLLFLGTPVYTQAAPASISAAATLTAAQIITGIVNYSGAAANLTMPTGTVLDATFTATLVPVDTSIDFSVINTGSGVATMVAASGVTIVGGATVAAGSSGLFRLRKTATATYVLYRIS